MALTEEQFIAAMRDSFSQYCADNGDILKVGSRDKLMTVRELRVVLLGQMMEIIEYYFRTTTVGDENFFTAEEIEDVIAHAQRIMKTEHYTELS